jgi:folate-binding protein YgfZ
MTDGNTTAARRVVAITGADRFDFLQGLVTNDVRSLKAGPAIVHAALLTPQGKYLADFFLVSDGDRVLLDVAEVIAAQTLQRLSMYKLRADVAFADTGLHVCRGLGEPPEGAHVDPRHPSLGWRHYADAPCPADPVDWDEIRVAACVPETGVELIPNETFILEAGFERLHGVDHRKGCYVGQEVTARMHHKTELRKGFETVAVDGPAEPGTEIVSADGKAAGRLYTRAGDRAIAYVRHDRAGGTMMAGDAKVWRIAPDE